MKSIGVLEKPHDVLLDTLAIQNEEIRLTFMEVIRISDRTHDAWDKAKELLANIVDNGEIIRQHDIKVLESVMCDYVTYCNDRNGEVITLWDFMMARIENLEGGT
jgi:hypothetical protein